MSYPSDNHASYDQALLSSVPGPTRQEKQVRTNPNLIVFPPSSLERPNLSGRPFLFPGRI